MKKLSLADITLLIAAALLLTVLMPVLTRLRKTTSMEKGLRRTPLAVPATTPTPPPAVSNTQGDKEALAAEDDAAEEKEIPRPPDGE